MTHRTQRRRRRHSSVCHRHPTSKPAVGLCATCLRERLSTIEALSSGQVPELRRVRDAEEEEGRASRRLLEEETEDGGGEKKTMKEFIDLESTTTHQTKKNDVASILTRTFKKLSLKPPKNGNNRETGHSRRSCDVDPRLESLDLSRNSLEEGRASWDGCLTGKTDPKLVPLSAVAEEEKDPGGTAQTRDYYFDSRRRRSFDRSTRHGLLEVDELKAKLSPSEGVGLFRGAKLLVTERELRDSDWYSTKPESLELASKDLGCVAAGEVKKRGKKWPKGWNLWGLIQRKDDADAVKKEIKTDVMEGPFVETLLKLRRVAAKGESSVSEKLMRSYGVSARKSCDGMFYGGRSSCDGLFHGSVTGVETGRRRRRRRSSCDDRFFHGIEDKGVHILQRDAKLESYNLRNGMVRFYLTPSKSHTTNNYGKSRLIH